MTTKVTKEKAKVNSSAIVSISYNYQSSALVIKFISGKSYVYENVSPEAYMAMKHNDSIGKFFNKNIKKFHLYKPL